MTPGLPILYICAAAGLAIVLGSLLLLWKGQIYLDRETKQVVEIELPLGIKVKSSIPVLALIVIGGALLIYSASEASKLGEEVTVEGDLTGSTSRVELYASVTSLALPRPIRLGSRCVPPKPGMEMRRGYETTHLWLFFRFAEHVSVFCRF